jgi:hypothetical protein
MFSGATANHARRQRRLVMVLVFAWLNLLIQPCQAGLPANPAAAAEHCDHRESPDHTLLCAAMQATACDMSADMNADAPAAGVPRPHLGVLLAVLLADSSGLIATVPHQGDPARATGPPLNIRFCNLRN